MSCGATRRCPIPRARGHGCRLALSVFDPDFNPVAVAIKKTELEGVVRHDPPGQMIDQLAQRVLIEFRLKYQPPNLGEGGEFRRFATGPRFAAGPDRRSPTARGGPVRHRGPPAVSTRHCA